MDPVSWPVQLDSLDGDEVRFVWADTDQVGGRLVLTIDRAKWEEIGRPSSLSVDITAA